MPEAPPYVEAILARRLITGRPVTTRLARQVVAAVLEGVAP